MKRVLVLAVFVASVLCLSLAGSALASTMQPVASVVSEELPGGRIHITVESAPEQEYGAFIVRFGADGKPKVTLFDNEKDYLASLGPIKLDEPGEGVYRTSSGVSSEARATPPGEAVYTPSYNWAMGGGKTSAHNANLWGHLTTAQYKTTGGNYTNVPSSSTTINYYPLLVSIINAKYNLNVYNDNYW